MKRVFFGSHGCWPIDKHTTILIPHLRGEYIPIMIEKKLAFLLEVFLWLDTDKADVDTARRDAWMRWAEHRIAFLERKLERSK